MYTTGTIKSGIQERRCSPDLRRCMCAALAFFCAFCFCLNPLQVKALASETIILGGCLIALLGACGIVYVNNGLNADEICQNVYDDFVSWNNTAKAFNNALDALAGMTMYRGYLQISNAASKLLSDFVINYSETNDGYILTKDYAVIDGQTIYFGYDNNSAYKFDFDHIYTNANGDKFYITYNNPRAILYVNGVEKKRFLLSYQSNKYWFRRINNYLYLQLSFNDGSGYGGSDNYFNELLGAQNGSLKVSSDTISTPLSSLNENDYTFVSPIGNANISTLDGYASAVGTAVQDNILASTWKNATTLELDDAIDNPPPELNDYDFTALGNLLSRKFPFSIPNDIKLAAQMLHYQAEAPVWTFQPLDVPGVPDAVAAAEVTIDLSDDTYAPWLAILRWGIVILYVAGLASATKNLIFE